MECSNDKTGINTTQEKDQLDSLIIYYQKGNMSTCIEKGNSFVIKHSDNDIGWQVLGGAYLIQVQDSLAEICTKKAILLNPNNSAALTNYAILLDKREKHNEAEIYYKKAIKVSPAMAQAYSNYVGNRLITGDYKTAVICGEKAVALADNLKDKGVLCVAYHKAGMHVKRDSLYRELEKLNYTHLGDLKEIFNN